MKRNTETIVDESGIEIIVGYKYENTPSYHAEYGNPGTFVGATVYTEIDNVELVIKGFGVPLLHLLSGKQIDYIKSLLNYEQ